MAAVFPWILWPFLFLGLLAPRKPGEARKEIPVAVGLVGTSLAIALLVAVDPRTQLFLVPLLAFYAAKGFAFLDFHLGHRVRPLTNRPYFLQGLLLAIAVVSFLGVNLNRLYLALSFGSPHHTVAAQNRQVARELDVFLGTEEGPVASFHPGIAVFADRDWRPLPYADLGGIVRFAAVSGAEVAVLSAYYPPFRGEEIMGTRYLILPIPDNAETVEEWEVEPVMGDTIRGLGRLQERS